MLYEAYYPSEGGDNGPIKIFYGFVQEGFDKNYQLTLVVFYPELTGTSLFNLMDKTKAGLANFLLQKHVYGVGASHLKVAFVCEHVNERDFYTEIWGVDVFENYALEQLEQQPKSLLSGIFGNDSKEVSIHSSYLNIGLTDSIKLIDEGHLDTDQTAYLLNKLKEKTDYGNFNKIFGE